MNKHYKIRFVKISGGDIRFPLVLLLPSPPAFFMINYIDMSF